MAINLLDMLKENISGDMISQASKFLGENESGVKSAMSDIMPSVLGSMINFGGTDAGAGKMMNMLKDGNHDGSVLDNLSGLFGGGQTTSGLVNTGSSLLKGMMGQSMLGSVVDMVSSRSGVSKSSSSSLMSMIAPIAMGMVGRYAKNKALDAVGLGSFLRGQQSNVMGALPSAISGLMGGNNPVKNVANNVRETASNATRGAANTASNVGRSAANATTEVAEKASGGIGRILKFAIPILAILGIASYFGLNTGVDAIDKVGDKVVNTTGNVVDGAKDVTKGAADMAKDVTKGAADMAKDAGNAVVDAGKGALDATTMAARKALDGVKFTAGSIGEGMANFMKAGAKGDKTFQFNNLNFASGKSTAADMSEIDNLAAVLKAYPNISIEVGGHTDSAGNAASNTQLSDARANTVKARLVAKGIDASRISTKGYGSVKPVASNDTAAGKAKNRRIEVMITKR